MTEAVAMNYAAGVCHPETPTLTIPMVTIVDQEGNPVAGGGEGGGAVSIADGLDATQGAKANAAASWYNTSASLVSLLKLLIAGLLGAGSHVYGYNASGQLTTDAWTFLGTTRTKTYTYTAGALTGESDWV